jgi:SAM-dependent methyltransferase
MGEDTDKYGQEYLNYQTNRSFLRKLIRQIYLNNICKYNIGKAIDFGSGAGELLKKLPSGSLGLEINEESVKYCRNINLNVDLYNPETDNYHLKDLQAGVYKTFIISHVLEHLDNPNEVINNLFQACSRLLVERIIIVVPCIKGFHFDKTHKNFIDEGFFRNNNFARTNGYYPLKMSFFPFNLKFVGRFFTYNELFVVFEKNTDAA